MIERSFDRKKIGSLFFAALSFVILFVFSHAFQPTANAAGQNESGSTHREVIAVVAQDALAAYESIQYEYLKMMIPTTIYHHGSIAGLTTEDLLAQSMLIATGRFSGESDSFQIQAVDGTVTNHTDYAFSIDHVIKGEPVDSAVIRVEGGTVGTFTEVFLDAPQINSADESLVFLYQPGVGAGVHTKGDYYYILGVTQGIFTKSSDGRFYNALSCEALPDEALTSPLLDEPVDKDSYRRSLIETFRWNYESGFDTREEYERNLEELDQYATVLR